MDITDLKEIINAEVETNIRAYEHLLKLYGEKDIRTQFVKGTLWEARFLKNLIKLEQETQIKVE